MKLPARYLASLLALPYYVAWKLLIAVGRRPRRMGPDPSRAPGPDLNPCIDATSLEAIRLGACKAR